MIEISDETIARIADGLRENFIDENDPISDSDLEFAVENWLLRTIYHIESNPAFYAAGVRVYRSSPHIPELELKPQCENIWCSEKPGSGSIFCKNHNRIFTR